jgi:hypothetical protein
LDISEEVVIYEDLDILFRNVWRYAIFW